VVIRARMVGGRMTEPFNKLTPAQAELIALLMEECGECVQACGKILRHGLDSVHPVTGEDNRYALEREMGDVQAIMRMICSNGMAATDVINAHLLDKLVRVERYLHHAVVQP
jgi:NTP pyrophosphatase (non-canonical NTP hydrolase)